MAHPNELSPLRNGAGAEPSWLKDRRDGAMKRFAVIGLPTRKQEAWRFSDVERLAAIPMPQSARRDGIDAAELEALYLAEPAHRIVLVNGHYAPEHSSIGALPEGAMIVSTAEALLSSRDLVEAAFDASELTGRQPFASLNAALFADGFVLALEPGVELDRPVQIIHYATAPDAQAFYLRNLISAGRGSKATIVETSTGTGGGWTNAVTVADIGAGAELRHVRIQNEAADAIHLALTRATLAEAARYDSFVLTLGAKMSRQDIQVVAGGESASVAINGACLLRGDQEATFAPFVDHAAPGCQTKEVVKALIQDRAHAVFLGKMTVRPGADQTDAHQLNQNLLLSPEARVDTKPELEIHADEVKCSHGATVGDLDDSAMFYLQARGIREADARHMLMEAFAVGAIDAAELGEPLSALLRQQVRGWLEGAGRAVS